MIFLTFYLYTTFFLCAMIGQKIEVVVFYEIFSGKLEPEWNLLLAIGLVREGVEEWRIQKDIVAVCGFLEGGHLCACGRMGLQLNQNGG